MFKKILVSVILALAIACATSPTGRRQLILMSDGQMNEMGVRAFSEIKSKTPRETNLLIIRYVQCVAMAVAREAQDSTGVKKWEVVVFRDKTANAFALPGGKIGVHTGLLKVAKTPGQLAAVLGHEVGHVIARHGAERVSQNLLTTGGLIAASVAFKDAEKRELIMGGLAVGAQFGILLPFSRSHESEADHIGQDLMARAGFNPAEAADLWVNMGKAGGAGPPEFMSTHPSHTTRINDLKAGLARANPLYKKALAQGKRPNCRRP